MNPIRVLARRAARLWVLERIACSVLLSLAWSGALLLLGALLVVRLGWSPTIAFLPVVIPLLICAVRAVRIARSAPQADKATQTLDARAGSNDLFASAQEFAREPAQFGWLGKLACEKALSAAAQTKLKARWNLGARRQWLPVAGLALLLSGVHGLLALTGWHGGADAAQTESEVIRRVAQTSAPASGNLGPDESEKPKNEPAGKSRVATEDFAPPTSAKEDDKQPEKITQEMLDRYLQNVPEAQEVNLEDISVAKWDVDELSGDKNQQNRRKEDEKIDPVKLDPTLLKDFENAKKTQAKQNGKEENKGVDVAVQGAEAEGQKSKEGGDSKKKDAGQLAGAASKDPRGNASRLSIKLEKQGLAIISSAKSVLRQKGQDRPMNLFEFMALVKKGDSKPSDASEPEHAGAKAADTVIRQENVSEQHTDLVQRYFDRLRKEDQ